MSKTFTLARAVEIAESVLNRKGDAYLFNGTLFAMCSVREAVQIESALLRECGCGIILSRNLKIGESSFDFV